MKIFAGVSKTKIVLCVSLTIIGIIIVVVTGIILTRNRCDVTEYNAQIKNIEFTDTDRGLRVTWTQPEVFATCDPKYHVKYTSVFGDFSYETASTSIIVPYEEFCLRIKISIRALAGSGTPYSTVVFDDVNAVNVSFTTQLADTNTLIVKWTHASQKWCSLTYDVTYVSDSNQFATVFAEEATFNFTYCTPAAIVIHPYANSDFSLPTITVDATQNPLEQQIGNVLSFSSIASDQSLSLEWEKVTPIGSCEVSYRINVVTDLATFLNVTSDSEFVITRDQFCFYVQVQFNVMMGTGTGFPLISTYTYGIPPVENLELSTSMTDNILVGTWTENWLQDQCFIQYLVTYEHGDTTNTITTNQPNVVFDIAYCANATVSVRTVHNSRQSEERSATHEEEYPTSVEQPQTATVEVNGTSALVSWESELSVSECNELYTVSAENAVGQTNSCQGATSCEIVLDDFCPYTNFTVSPTREVEESFEWAYECA